MKIKFVFLFLALSLSAPAHAILCNEYFHSKNNNRQKQIVRSPWDYIARAFVAPRSSKTDIIKAIAEAYPEVRWLKSKTAVSPETANFKISPDSPSMLVYGESHPEFDRTMVSILNLRQIIRNDYEGYVSEQPGSIKLSKASFKNIRSLFMKVLTGSDKGTLNKINYTNLDALITYMSIHDLGKSRFFSDIVEKVMSFVGDHDTILVKGIEQEPVIAPSFERLPKHLRELILKGIKGNFNFGQFAQGENVPGSLLGLSGLDQVSFDFYLAHFILDVGAVQGHAFPHGAKVMTEVVYKGFALGQKFIPDMFRGETAEAVYSNYLKNVGEKWALDTTYPEDRALVRIGLLARAADKETVTKIKEVFNQLPQNAKAILLAELNKDGTTNDWATLIYYAPATIANIVNKLKANGHPTAYETGIRVALMTFARIFHQARADLKTKTGGGVYTVDIAKIAEQALRDPLSLLGTEFDFKRNGDFADVHIRSPKIISSALFPRQFSLNQIPGKRIAVVGIGGGSDGIQAAQLALLLKKLGKEIVYVASVRTDKTASIGASGKEGESRTILNHGGEITEGVFRVLPESSGSGRFLENLPSDLVPTYLVIDKQDGTLTTQFNILNKKLYGLDTIITVDTGGDVLFPIVGVKDGDKAKATPDQDLRVLTAVRSVNVSNKISSVIATGVDTPSNAESVLKHANAKYYSLSPDQISDVLSRYELWDMTGANEARYGKTALAWQSALKGQTGLRALNMPTRVVLDSKNPWNPFVYVTESMAGIFFMDLQKHYETLHTEGL